MAEIIPSMIKFCGQNAAVRAAFSTRIFGNLIPGVSGDQAYPHARMREITNPRNYTHQGNAGRLCLVQIDVYDDDEAGANTNSELIRALFDGYKGVIGDVVAGMVTATRINQTWDETKRNFWRIIQVEVMTND